MPKNGLKKTKNTIHNSRYALRQYNVSVWLKTANKILSDYGDYR